MDWWYEIIVPLVMAGNGVKKRKIRNRRGWTMFARRRRSEPPKWYLLPVN
jgi:hypothetical protein